MFGTEEWAIQTYNRLTDGSGQSSCVDIEKLHFYIVMSSVYTGQYKSVADVEDIEGEAKI